MYEQPREVPRRGDGLADRPTADLMKELFEDGQELLRQEVRLAKAEIREELKRAARAAGMIAGGGAVFYAALLAGAATLIAIGATVLPLWLSALIVTVLLGAAGGVAVVMGRRELQQLEPERTVKSLKEDRQWAKETMQSIRSSRHAHA